MKMKLKGTIVVTKKNVLEVKDVGAGIHDGIDELLGKKVSIRLVSSIARDGMSWFQWLRTSLLFRTLVGNPDSEFGCVVGAPACLEHWLTTHTGLKSDETALQATFDWDDQLGEPVALLVRNQHHNEFFLKSVTLEDYFPAAYGTKVQFECNSWVYPAHCYKKDRVFFTNKPYLPHETPKALRRLREEELQTLRGNGKGMLQVWDRVYDYAYYNDLGEPDKGSDYVRPTLGGSADYPYPRRCRTGREPTNTDPNCETRIPLVKSLDIYVPRDERFFSLKLADFAVFALKAVTEGLIPELEALTHLIPNEFESFQDVIKLYEGGIVLPNSQILEKIRDAVPFELIKELLLNDGKTLLKFPVPAIIKENKDAWRTDEEFAREMLAGLNPLVIRLLEKFPPTSNLDPTMYGNQNSKITREDVEPSLQGLTIYEALRTNRLFILDYNDIVMPYLRRINKTSTKMYATRTILFLKDDGTLKPVVIELILPHPEGDAHGAISKVIKPAQDGVKGTLWQLAKAHVGINDSGYHQLISHWLHTHASMEPFVIATNRQLSVLHPIHKLLHPHYRDTMSVNALARGTLINAKGIFESTVFPGRYSFEMSSYLYRNWVFTDQALPNDLLKRGMAVKDKESPSGYRLLIEDYPYAVDGLEIWNAIQTWVKKYCALYYKSDDMVSKDTELQQWWKEVREKAHGDKKDEPWWPKMKTVEELTETCTTIIWVASALHAAINFGQYPYGGFLLNRPTISRRFLPELGTRDYEEMETNPEKTLLKTVTGQPQTLLGIAAIEVLSNHGADEIYLGQRESPTWTSDVEALKAFKEFGEELKKIELNIMERNANEKLKNRVGPANFPYTLLYPSSGNGMTCKGIPNSVSI